MKEEEESKKKRVLSQEWISSVSVHKATWEGDRKRSGSLKMFDLYLAAPLYNGELMFQQYIVWCMQSVASETSDNVSESDPDLVLKCVQS